VCRLPVWRYAASFYPAKIIKTAELDPEGHYIFAAHPHGIFCSSLFLAFATDALNFSKVGPEARHDLFCNSTRAALISHHVSCDAIGWCVCFTCSL